MVRVFVSWALFDARKKDRGVWNGPGGFVWDVDDSGNSNYLAHLDFNLSYHLFALFALKHGGYFRLTQ